MESREAAGTELELAHPIPGEVCVGNVGGVDYIGDGGGDGI